MKPEEKKLNYEYYDETAKSMIMKLVEIINKGDKSYDKALIKSAFEVARLSQKLMREHNSRINQERNNRKFEWEIFNAVADEKDKKKLRDVLKIDVTKLRLLEQ